MLMSGTNNLNQGVTVKPSPNFLSEKANLLPFQCIEFISGSVAAPTSPIAPCLLSGLIIKNGTAVVIGFIVPVNPLN